MRGDKPYPSQDAIEQLALARKRTAQLRRALDGLLHALPETHERWCNLIYGVDIIERQLEGAMEAIARVFLQDPSGYTRPPRLPWP